MGNDDVVVHTEIAERFEYLFGLGRGVAINTLDVSRRSLANQCLHTGRSWQALLHRDTVELTMTQPGVRWTIDEYRRGRVQLRRSVG